jgi:hypothetical protein
MNKKLFIGAVLLAMTPFLITQGCGQMAYGPGGANTSDSASLGVGGGGGGGGSAPVQAPAPTANPVALLSSEQVLKGMASVTGVPVNATIMTEYNTRSAVLATGNDLGMVNSPMLIGLTNLASQFCQQLVTNEAAMAAASRRFTASIDYTKGVSSVTDANYSAVTNAMAMAFWGRPASSDENTILLQAKADFISGLTGSALTAASGTSNLMLYTCTGMLASFEAYSF